MVLISNCNFLLQKASLVVGDVANVRFQVSLDNSSEVTQGHHYAVTMTGLLWHSSASVKYVSPLSAYSMEFVVPGELLRTLCRRIMELHINTTGGGDCRYAFGEMKFLRFLLAFVTGKVRVSFFSKKTCETLCPFDIS